MAQSGRGQAVQTLIRTNKARSAPPHVQSPWDFKWRALSLRGRARGLLVIVIVKPLAPFPTALLTSTCFLYPDSYMDFISCLLRLHSQRAVHLRVLPSKRLH
jgi:hypothetical protein